MSWQLEGIIHLIIIQLIINPLINMNSLLICLNHIFFQDHLLISSIETSLILLLVYRNGILFNNILWIHSLLYNISIDYILLYYILFIGIVIDIALIGRIIMIEQNLLYYYRLVIHMLFFKHLRFFCLYHFIIFHLH